MGFREIMFDINMDSSKSRSYLSVCSNAFISRQIIGLSSRLRCVLALMLVCLSMFAQQEDRVLFSVDGNPVGVQEFQYHYEKTNAEQSDYSKKSVDEYLNLYANFKLKIAEAKEMGLDKRESLITELEGYKNQLSSNYLLDKKVLESLALEVYDRQKEDVKLAHIMVAIPARGIGDTTAAYKRIMEAYAQLQNGVTFDEVCKTYSTDKRTNNKGGELGWRVSMFPNGFYNIENVAYATAIGSYSKPVRSSVAYHIIKVLDKRPARGKIKVAQIYLKDEMSGNVTTAAKHLIDSLYQALIFGGDFDAMVKQYSQDKKTKNKGGVIEEFGIGRYTIDFENAAFALQEDGQFSAPVKTSKGWHIIKRIEKEDRPSFLSNKKLLEAKVKRSDRYVIAENALIEGLKEDLNYKDYNVPNVEVRKALVTDIFDNQWTMPEDEVYKIVNLFDMDSKTYTTKDFLEYLSQNRAFRFKHNIDPNKSKAFNSMYDAYKKNVLLEYEESMLEEKYPEFRNLMREYREGILMFEVQTKNVWGRGVDDPDALRAFYESHRSNYLETPIADIQQITVNTQDPMVLAKVKKQLSKKPVEKVMAKFNKATEVISFTNTQMDTETIDSKGWKAAVGYLTDAEQMEDGKTNFAKIVTINPGKPKTFENARGAVIVDYQNDLEAKWLKELKGKHKVVINEDVLSSLYK